MFWRVGGVGFVWVIGNILGVRGSLGEDLEVEMCGFGE